MQEVYSEGEDILLCNGVGGPVQVSAESWEGAVEVLFATSPVVLLEPRKVSRGFDL